MLTTEQGIAFSTVSAGHNLLITGQAGTGKTYLIKQIVKHLQTTKNVSILCTTGMGCLQYECATTVHRWGGLYDGRYDTLTLQNLVVTDDKYENVRQNVSKCDLVIVDEVSMLSLKEFEQFETVCRVVRGNNSLFGGIQVLLCGDFYQLSPVGNELYNDSGRFCFESEVFKESITHRVDLKKVVRQEEHLLIKAVRETALGSISPEVDTFLKSLQRPVPEDVKPVHLFAKNIDSTLYNNDCLTKHVGEERVYRATKNSGSEKYLRKILAPNYLQMKIGCPVILLLNLGGKLVNGLSGSVKKLDENVIHVHFNAIRETHSIRRHLFSKYSTKENRNIAEREQFPLMLGYGITIHKAQGMTLENVFVHCKGIFQAGQLSVGIGRAVTSVGLFLSDYRKGLCPQPKAAISQFYGKESKPLLDDFTCCSKNSIHVANNIESDGDHCVDSDGSDLDSEGQEDIDDEFQMPPYIKPEELKLIAYTKDPMTITQKTINDICLNMDETKLRKFVSLQYKRIKTALPDEMSLKSTSTKNWTSIFSNQHQYLESQQYRADLQIVFGTLINDDHSHIGSDIVFGILKSVIENLAEQVTTEPSQMTSFKRGPITDAGKAKVRNVAGMCIFKVRNHYVNIILSNIGNPDPTVREHVKKAQGRVEILNKMIADIDSYDLEHDKSLEDIERRQNVRKSLTCVSDKTFQFFLLLNFNVHQVLNMSTLQKEKENVFESAKNYLEGNEDLHMIFFELFENTDDSDTIFDLYKAIIYKYLMVCHKQLIKDTKDNLNIEKKKAHREEITKKKEKRKMEVNLTMKDILSDTSEGKESSHLKLKVNCITGVSFFNSASFTKNDLFRLCSAYGVRYESNMNKAKLAEVLGNRIKSSESIDNADFLKKDAPLPSTSSKSKANISKRKRTKEPGKGKGKGKGKRSATKYNCKICDEEYVDGEDWIQCDDCNKWFHRMCGGDLSDDDRWETIQDEEVPWSCTLCRQ